MTPHNNLSVLPFYTSIEQQNARKWWIAGKVYPLFAPVGKLLPFQFQLPITEERQVLEWTLYDKSGNVVADLTGYGTALKQKVIDNSYSVIIFDGQTQILPTLDNGQYYMYLEIDTDTQTWFGVYSEIFTVVNDISGYLKLEWWDDADFVMDAGAIVYTGPAYKNVLYLCSEIAKPEYNFTEEIIERDGYTFPVKQVSEKKYRFSFLASEYLLDVLRFVRMSDHVTISKDGQTFVNVDTFLITPDWEAAGDVAVVDAEFTTDTVAKKNGHVYIPE